MSIQKSKKSVYTIDINKQQDKTENDSFGLSG